MASGNRVISVDIELPLLSQSHKFRAYFTVDMDAETTIDFFYDADKEADRWWEQFKPNFIKQCKDQMKQINDSTLPLQWAAEEAADELIRRRAEGKEEL